MMRRPQRTATAPGGEARWSLARTALSVLVLHAAVLAARPAAAQFMGTQCQVVIGACLSPPAPVGSPCACFTPGGQFPGQIVSGMGGWGGPPVVTQFCRTFAGVCQMYPAPVGAPCNCMGQPGVAILP